MPLPYQYSYKAEQFTVYQAKSSAEIASLAKLDATVYPQATHELGWSRSFFERTLNRGFAIAIHAGNNQEPVAFMLIAKPQAIRRTRSHTMPIGEIHGQNNFVMYTLTVTEKYQNQAHIIVQLFTAAAQHLQTMDVMKGTMFSLTLQRKMQPILAKIIDNMGFSTKIVDGKEIRAFDINALIATILQRHLPAPSLPTAKSQHAADNGKGLLWTHSTSQPNHALLEQEDDLVRPLLPAEAIPIAAEASKPKSDKPSPCVIC